MVAKMRRTVYGLLIFPMVVLLIAEMFDPLVTDATTVQASTANRSATLGGAYQSEKQGFVGQACLTGNEVDQGAQRASFSFDQQLKAREASNLLGLEAGGRARFGAVEASASARFLKNSMSTDQPISVVWLSEYTLPNKKFIATPKDLNAIGVSVRSNDTRWAKTCGDEYVDEKVLGARLFFSIRIDFSTLEQKQAFEAQFSVSGPLASVNGKMEQASREFSRDTKITVSALQFGGDVSKLTGIFADSVEGRAGFVECTLGSFSKCAAVVGSALAYATDTTKGFPSQIAPGAKPGPGTIEYHTAPYSSIGIYPNNYPYLDEANEQARARLHGSFEEQFRWSIFADRLLETGLAKEQRQRVEAQRNALDGNIDRILKASKVCYEDPLNCRKEVTAITLTDIDLAALQLPPVPTASFRIWTSQDGVWDRVRSVGEMRTCRDKKLPPLDDSKPPLSCGRPTQLFNLAGDGSASVVLFIQGTGLQEAILYFENKIVEKLSLVPGQSSYAEKYGPGWAALVIESTRQNAGWRDIDLAAAREDLWKEKLPEADGVFYMIVRDAFARTSRFDLEYQKWSRHVEGMSPNATITENFAVRNRWSDPSSDGISVVGGGDWSREATGSTSRTGAQ